jgi:integrase
VEKVLNALPRALHHDFVFTYNGLPVKKLRRSFESACKNAGIPYGQKVPGGLRFHDIRATFKTNMLRVRAGVDKVFRDVILGHSLQGMDARYLKPTDDDLLKAIERYTEWFDSQILTDTTSDTSKKTRLTLPTNSA